MTFDKNEMIAKLRQEVKAKEAEIEQQVAIYNLLPDGCSAPKFIQISELYGCQAILSFRLFGSNLADGPAFDLKQLTELLPATGCLTSAPSHAYCSFIAETDEAIEAYDKSESSKSNCEWMAAGRYLFKLNYVESSGLAGGNLCTVEWWTLLGETLVEVNVDFSPIGSSFIQYGKERWNSKTWHWTLSDRFAPGIKYRTTWASVKGREPVTVYHPNGPDLFDMFNFNGLL